MVTAALVGKPADQTLACRDVSSVARGRALLQTSGLPMQAPGVATDEMTAMASAVRRAVGRALRPAMASYADDIAQSAMERLVARMRADPSTKPRTQRYLWMMANHAVIDEIRALQRRRESPESEEGIALVGNPHDSAHRRELGEAITACVGALPLPRRRAVTLYLQGHGVTEAAEILGWVRKQADNAVYRGLAAVRRCLEGKGITP